MVWVFSFFRIASLQDVHRAHQREYGKYVEDIESSKITVQELEKSSDAAMNYKFYRGMKTYVENLVNCFNEKVCMFSFPSPPCHPFLWDDKVAFCQCKNEISCLEMVMRDDQL